MKRVIEGSEILRSGILDYDGKASSHTTVVDVVGKALLEYMESENYFHDRQALSLKKRRVCLRPDGQGCVYFLDSQGFGKAVGDLVTVVSDPYDIWDEAAREATKAKEVSVVELSQALEQERSLQLMLMLLSLSICYFEKPPMGQK